MLIDVFKVISIAYLKRSFTVFWALDGFGPTRSSSKQVHGFSCCKKEALLLDTAVADHHDVRICGLFFKLRNIFATSGQLNSPFLCSDFSVTHLDKSQYVSLQENSITNSGI